MGQMNLTLILQSLRRTGGGGAARLSIQQLDNVIAVLTLPNIDTIDVLKSLNRPK